MDRIGVSVHFSFFIKIIDIFLPSLLLRIDLILLHEHIAEVPVKLFETLGVSRTCDHERMILILRRLGDEPSVILLASDDMDIVVVRGHYPYIGVLSKIIYQIQIQRVFVLDNMLQMWMLLRLQESSYQILNLELLFRNLEFGLIHLRQTLKSLEFVD